MRGSVLLPCFGALALALAVTACPRREPVAKIPEREAQVTCPDSPEFIWAELPRPDAGTISEPVGDGGTAPEREPDKEDKGRPGKEAEERLPPDAGTEEPRRPGAPTRDTGGGTN